MATENAAEAHDTTEAGGEILEGIFAISKPSGISSGALLLTLQSTFLTSTLFAPLLASTQPQNNTQPTVETTPPTQETNPLSKNPFPPKDDDPPSKRPFRIGHAGTLDPLASGILIIGLHRGTKALPGYLHGSKTYETVVLFGVSTDTYDSVGRVAGRADATHVTRELVKKKLERFKGTIMQMPPVYSGLKVGGRKAVEWVGEGKEVPGGGLVEREVGVEEVEITEWIEEGEYEVGVGVGVGEEERGEGEKEKEKKKEQIAGPAVRIRLTVSSGFYVRSFAHDLGIACGSLGTMVELVRTRQAGFVLEESTPRLSLETNPGTGIFPEQQTQANTALNSSPAPKSDIPALSYAALQSGESTWGPLIKAQLQRWMAENPPPGPRTHVNGRDPGTKKRLSEEEKNKARQRFRGEWVGTSRRERRRQQKAAKMSLAEKVEGKAEGEEGVGDGQ